MKVNLERTLKGIDGKADLLIEGKLVTSRDVCVNAILNFDNEDDQKTKWEKYIIFKKIRDAGKEIDIESEEISILKKYIGILYPPLIMGQVFEILEGKINT